MEPESTNTEPKEKNIFLYLGLWLVAIISVFVIIYFIRGWSEGFFPTAVLIMGLGAAVIYYLGNKATHSSKYIPAAIEDKVDQTMRDLMASCEFVYAFEIDNRITPLLDKAEQQFNEGLNWLMQSEEKLVELINSGLAKLSSDIQSIVHLFRQEDMIPEYKSFMLRIESCVNLLHDSEKVHDKANEEMSLILKRLGREAQFYMEKEKEAAISYLKEILAARIMDDYESKRLFTETELNSLVDQFRVLLVSGIQRKVPALEERIARAMEDMATRTVGSIQNFGLNQVNSITQLQEALIRLSGQTRISSDLHARLNNIMQELVALRTKANDILFALAWEDTMVEKRWQDWIDKMEPMRSSALQAASSELVAECETALGSEIRGFAAARNQAVLKPICDNLLIAEVQFRILTSTPGQAWDETFIHFQYAYALEVLARSMISWPGGQITEVCRVIRDELRADRHQEIFKDVQYALGSNASKLKEYIKDVFPRDMISFCSEPNLQSRPANCGQAGWMLMINLIEWSQEKGDAYNNMAYLCGLLLAVNSLRNRYIHPTRSNQVIAMGNRDHLLHMRTAVINAFDLLLPHDQPVE